MIFRTGDVSKDGVIVAFLDQSHGHAGHSTLERDARVIKRQAGAADRSHRRRAVGFKNVGHDADGVRRLFRTGKNCGDCALGKCSVANFAATRAGHTSCFTNAERRKVVVKHEGLLLLAFIALQPLSIVLGAECGRNQGLGFTACKQRRAVHAGQNFGLDGDFTNLVEGAAIGTDPLLGHLLAEGALAEQFIIVRQLLLGGWIRALLVGGQFGHEFVLDLLHERIAVGLGVLLGVERVLQLVADLGLQLFVIGFIGHRRSKGPLGLAGHGNQLVDGGNDFLNLRMSELDGGQDDVFRLFLGARLDHHDAVLVADNHDVDRSLSALGVGGINDKLAIHTTDAHSANRGAEGDVGKRQRCRGGVDADHVGIVFLVGGENQRDDLRLVAETIREERADGAIDLAAGQHFFFAGPAFTLDKATGNASTCIGVFAVIHGQGEEVDAFPGVGRCNSSCQHHGFARGYQCGARGLLGHAAGLKDQPLAAGKLDRYFMLRHRVLVSFFSLGKFVMGRRRWALGKVRSCREGAECAQMSGFRARERILPFCLSGCAPGPRADDSCAQALAAGSVRQVHHGPRFWVERGP